MDSVNPSENQVIKFNAADLEFSSYSTKIAGVNVEIYKDGTVTFDIDGLCDFDLNLIELISIEQLATNFRNAWIEKEVQPPASDFHER